MKNLLIGHAFILPGYALLIAACFHPHDMTAFLWLIGAALVVSALGAYVGVLCAEGKIRPRLPMNYLARNGGGRADRKQVVAAYEAGKRVKVTGEPYEVEFSDSPDTLAFWDGYYGRPLKRRD